MEQTADALPIMWQGAHSAGAGQTATVPARSEKGDMMKIFQTTVLGLGPFCVELEDGEIITTRTEQMQLLIAAAPELLNALKSAASTAHYRGTLRNASQFCAGTFEECTNCQPWKDVIDKAVRP